MKEKEIKQIKRLLNKYLKNIEIEDVYLKTEEADSKDKDGNIETKPIDLIYIRLKYLDDEILMAIDYDDWNKCSLKEKDQAMMYNAGQVAQQFAKRLFLKDLN